MAAVLCQCWNKTNVDLSALNHRHSGSEGLGWRSVRSEAGWVGIYHILQMSSVLFSNLGKGVTPDMKMVLVNDKTVLSRPSRRGRGVFLAVPTLATGRWCEAYTRADTLCGASCGRSN